MCKYCVLSLMVLFVFISFVKADLSDGLVLYLPFDEGEGDVANDLSENQFTGDLMGDPEWVDGKEGFGKALSFGGNGDYVEVPYDDDFTFETFDIKEAITMCAWVMPFDLEWRGIINANKSQQGPWGMLGFLIGGKVDLNTYYFFEGVQYSAPSGGASLQRDVFQHVCSAYDKDDGAFVYYDGVQKGRDTFGRGLMDSPAPGSLVIGQMGGSHFWNGVIDEVMVYNRVLSADEVAQLFEAQFVPKEDAVSSSGKLATAWGRVKRSR